MDRTKYAYLDAMSKNPKIGLAITGPGFKNYVDALWAIQTYLPDLIVVENQWVIAEWKDLQGYNIPIIKFYNETFHKKEIEKDIVETGIDLAVFHHPEHIKDFTDLFPLCQFRGIQHRVDTSIFHEMNLKREYDLMITGCMAPELYPLRDRLLKMMQSGKFSKWKTVIIPHPGYKISDAEKQFKQYATTLNTAKIVLGCSSIYRYPLSKYMEYPACGALMAGDIPAYRPDFFRDIGIELDMSFTDEKIIETLDYWLSHDIERLEKTNHAYDIIQSQYNTSQYVDRFLEIIEETDLLHKNKLEPDPKV